MDHYQKQWTKTKADYLFIPFIFGMHSLYQIIRTKVWDGRNKTHHRWRKIRVPMTQRYVMRVDNRNKLLKSGQKTSANLS